MASNNKGIVLVVVLWVLVVLAVLTVALANNTKLDNAIRIGEGERVRARWLARAGVYRAISDIARDDSITDGEHDGWFDNAGQFKQIPLPGGTFTVYADRNNADSTIVYGIVDEAARININTADLKMLLAVPNMTEAMAGGILDWRVQRQEILKATGNRVTKPGGSVVETESAIETLRTVPFSTVREAALAAGLTKEELYGEDTNLNGVLDECENDGEESWPPDNRDGVLDQGILGRLTVYSYELNQDGLGRTRININKASEEELINELSLSAGEAKWIGENRPFSTIADLLDDTVRTSISVSDSPSVSAAVTMTTELPAGEEEGEEEEIVSIRPDLATFSRIADQITVRDDEVIPGRININTADKIVLQSLPGVSPQAADQIIKARSELPQGFYTIADLIHHTNIIIPDFKKCAPLITVRSNVFTIRSLGQTEWTGIRHTIEAVVARGDVKPVVLYWKESD